MKDLHDALTMIEAKKLECDEYTTSIRDFVRGMQPIDNGFRVDKHIIVMDKVAEFSKQRLKANPAILKDSDLTTQFKLEYLIQKVNTVPDHTIAVRTYHNHIIGTSSEYHQYFNNLAIGRTILDMYEQGNLPKNIKAHTFHISGDGSKLHMRLVAPDEWDYRNGDHFYGGVLISNDEMASIPLHIAAALARVSCFNYTLGENTFDVNAVLSTEEEARLAIQSTIFGMSEFAEKMLETMHELQALILVNTPPEFVLRKIAVDLKLDEKTTERMMQYWVAEGRGRSIFDVVQAVTFATQGLTIGIKHNWSKRDRLETDIWRWGRNVVEAIQEGEDLEAYINTHQLISKRAVINVLEQQPDTALTVIEGLEPVRWL